MAGHGSVFFAAGNAGGDREKPLSVFGTRQPAEQLVREVVRFAPAPDPYKAIERASQRMADGRSVFEDTVQGAAGE